MKNISTKTLPKKVIKTERHIRWNWEASPDSPETARYHFIVVDDKNRDMKMCSLIEKISGAGVIHCPVTLIRTAHGKVKGSELRYFFQTYDSEIKIGGFIGINKPVKRDPELKERVKSGLSIEQYVADTYNPAD
ncbi:MAG: hypothetical protein AABY15_09705 [Nanoarchaeota archaeon]